MADEGCIHSAVAVEPFFEGKNHQHFVDVIAQEQDASLTPCPELWRNVVGHRNAALLHLPRYAPVERWRVDHDGEIGLAAVGFCDQTLVKAINLGQMAEDFSDADDGEIFRVDDGFATCGAHASSADAEEFELRIAAAQGFDELRAVHFSGSFAG